MSLYRWDFCACDCLATEQVITFLCQVMDWLKKKACGKGKTREGRKAKEEMESKEKPSVELL